MPLSEPTGRREAHHRQIDMWVYARDDGLFDVEAHLVDRKPFPFKRVSRPDPIPAGEPLHDLWVRLTVDVSYVVHSIDAASDVTPFPLCREAEATLSVLVGEKVARGWSAKVKERLRGAAGCTHLMEMLITMGTSAHQGIRGLNPEQVRSTSSDGVPLKLDSCYAYGRQREVVKMLWPEHYKAKQERTD